MSGSGIFTTPAYILEGTGSVGASLLLWTIGGLIATCGLLVWLELGLSLPISKVPGEEDERNVPRSGGEKNYVSDHHMLMQTSLRLCSSNSFLIVLLF